MSSNTEPINVRLASLVPNLKMQDLKRTGFLLTCVVPTFLIFCFFVVYPTLQVFVKAFYNWNGLGDSQQFVGLQNFIDLYNDEIFWIAVKNTAFLMLVVPVVELVVALFFAYILTLGKLKEENFYRIVFFFPSILSYVVIAILWSFILHPTMGVLNAGLEAVGLAGWTQVWLGDAQTVLWAIAAAMIWKSVGYFMVLYLAGIDTIPGELFEAASIDGAGHIQQFFKITIPMLWEIIRITIIFSINGVITISFVMVTIMTAGGPNYASEVALTYMYNQGFINVNFGYAMAISVTVFIVSVFLALMTNRATARE